VSEWTWFGVVGEDLRVCVCVRVCVRVRVCAVLWPPLMVSYTGRLLCVPLPFAAALGVSIIGMGANINKQTNKQTNKINRLLVR